ncbi:MAG: NADP-dependent oxidoreductase [Acidobacteriia bacterium]|nr:NADP-dependent oxidoreductase [Terriglobia bacterium]
MPATNRQLLLKSRPKDLISRDNFTSVTAPVPELRDGQALAKVHFLSVDPTMRIWMSEREGYMPPVGIGEVMRAGGIAQVIASKNPEFHEGDFVLGLTGFQEYVLLGAGEPVPFRKLPQLPGVPLSAFLGTLGMTGITAYFGMTEVGKPKAGETLVVSAAAGATGSVAGQIGKIHGCRVVGIAGGAEKCAWLTGELGFDHAVDYKKSGWKQELAAACPKGIDIDYENVGGEIMHTVMSRMNPFGRIVLCGLISGYSAEDPGMASFGTVLIKRLRVQGFIVLDYAPRFTEAVTQLAQWMLAGKLKDRQTVVEGLENAPDALAMLFSGGNIGKTVVKL